MNISPFFPMNNYPIQVQEFFREPLAEIFLKKRRQGAKLTEEEFDYVVSILINNLSGYRPKKETNQLHLSEVAGLILAYRSHGLLLADALDMAERCLLLIGYFHGRGAVRMRGRNEYPLQFYAETAQTAYMACAMETDIQVYQKVSDHFYDWLSALWLLRNLQLRRSLERFLIGKV